MSNANADAADRIVVSYRAPGVDAGSAEGGWIERELDSRHFRRYLRTAHAGPVAVGDEFEEFVSRGCGRPRDVVLRVEAVEGGTALGGPTALSFVPREGDGRPDGETDAGASR